MATKLFDLISSGPNPVSTRILGHVMCSRGGASGLADALRFCATCKLAATAVRNVILNGDATDPLMDAAIGPTGAGQVRTVRPFLATASRAVLEFPHHGVENSIMDADVATLMPRPYDVAVRLWWARLEPMHRLRAIGKSYATRFKREPFRRDTIFAPLIEALVILTRVASHGEVGRMLASCEDDSDGAFFPDIGYDDAWCLLSADSRLINALISGVPARLQRGYDTMRNQAISLTAQATERMATAYVNKVLRYEDANGKPDLTKRRQVKCLITRVSELDCIFDGSHALVTQPAPPPPLGLLVAKKLRAQSRVPGRWVQFSIGSLRRLAFLYHNDEDAFRDLLSYVMVWGRMLNPWWEFRHRWHAVECMFSELSAVGRSDDIVRWIKDGAFSTLQLGKKAYVDWYASTDPAQAQRLMATWPLEADPAYSPHGDEQSAIYAIFTCGWTDKRVIKGMCNGARHATKGQACDAWRQQLLHAFEVGRKADLDHACKTEAAIARDQADIALGVPRRSAAVTIEQVQKRRDAIVDAKARVVAARKHLKDWKGRREAGQAMMKTLASAWGQTSFDRLLDVVRQHQCPSTSNVGAL
jgi:hypothetical protein